MTMRAEQVGDPSGRAACAERRTRSARQIVLAPRRRARGGRQSRRRFHFSSTGFFTANSAGDSCRSFIKSALRRSLRAMRSATTVGRRGVSSVVSSPREVSRMPKPAPPLSRRLEAAFARLDPATPVPPWPRAIRLGVDYALRVVGMNPQTDAEADGLARTCFILGQLQQRDPPGDPPATCTAHEHVGRAGADCARAFDLLGQIRDGSAEWARYGWAVPTLADHTMRILQRAARGERVRDDVLAPVLAAAEHVAGELGMRLLASYPIDAAHPAGLDQRDGT